MRTTVLPVHPRTGLTALGVIGGKPVWPVLGAEDPPKDPPADLPKPPDPPPTDPPPDPPDDTDWKAEAEKWKAASRKHEDRAKQNTEKAKQFDELKRSQMSDQDKAVDEARTTAAAAAKAEAAKEFGGRLVDAEIRAATAGRLSDSQRTALLEGLDRSWFLTDAGEVDTAKVKKFVDAVAPAAPVTGGARMGQGRQPGNATSTLTTGRERYEASRKRTTSA